MMMVGALILAAAQIAVPGSPKFDLHCMIAVQSAHDQAEGEMKAATMLAVMFYFGRVDAVTSGDDLERALATVDAELKGKPLAPLMAQCGEFMSQRGTALQAVASRVQDGAAEPTN